MVIIQHQITRKDFEGTGLGKATIQALAEDGVVTVEQLLGMGTVGINAISGIDDTDTLRVFERAQAIVADTDDYVIVAKTSHEDFAELVEALPKLAQEIADFEDGEKVSSSDAPVMLLKLRKAANALRKEFLNRRAGRPLDWTRPAPPTAFQPKAD